MTASDLRLELGRLMAERLDAAEAGLGSNALYMRDLEDDLAAAREAYVGLAVTEIASLRGVLCGRHARLIDSSPAARCGARLVPMAARRFRSAARVALFLAAGGRCARCGTRLAPGWHADHVVPRRAGGDAEPANGQALCPRCNLAKGGRVA